MPVILSFVILVIVVYYILVTGESSMASWLPWSDWFRNAVSENLLIAHSVASIVSLIGFFIAGASVMLVRGKTLVVGGKKTLIIFTALFVVMTVVLGSRVFTLALPLLNSLVSESR